MYQGWMRRLFLQGLCNGWMLKVGADVGFKQWLELCLESTQGTR